jgi:predicted nucleotidyltransferase
MAIKAREGDLVENTKGVVFDVKGLIHPPDKIVAFPRFIPDASGNRKRRNTAYGKIYSLSERFRFLEQRFPHYLVHDPVFDETLCEIPVDEVKKHYEPVERLQELRNSRSLDPLETWALQLTGLLKETAEVPWDAIGISGSILAGLHTARSDIDPIVYGSQNCRKVYATLGELMKDESGPFKPYSREELKALFDFRSKDTTTSFEDFVRTESRKIMQGKFMGIDYFVRFVKNWNEIDESYGDIHYKNVGHARIEATVVDDSESVFTPCVYRMSNVWVLDGPNVEHVEEIASFRGRFCEQAKEGEDVIAQGKVERITDRRRNHEHFRLLLGNKPSDHMILRSTRA